MTWQRTPHHGSEEDQTYYVVDSGHQQYGWLKPTTSSSRHQEEGNLGLDVAAVELLSLCQSASTPLYFYDAIIGILKRHNKKGSLNIRKLPSRGSLLRTLRVKIETPVPVPCTVKTGTNNDITISKFSFIEQLKDLISMTYFDDINNLCANVEESRRFDKYEATKNDDYLEVCTGQWYHDTYHEMCSQQGKHNMKRLLMPLVFYVDKTGTDNFQRYLLEPLMFTTALLRRDIRRKADAWRHLGFIPPDSIVSPGLKSAQDKLQGYHDCLSAMISDLRHLQKHPPCLEVNLGGIECLVSVILPIAFVIGDQESQDYLCGRKKSNHKGRVTRVHRSCMCSSLHCGFNGDPSQTKHICRKPFPSSKVIWQLRLAANSYSELVGVNGNFDNNPTLKDNQHEQMLHLELMRCRSNLACKILENTLGMYPIKNAFDDVSFGANKDGIYTATCCQPPK